LHHREIRLNDVLNDLQWPAMVVTVLASWLVTSKSEHARHWSFWCFLVSNALWIAWGWHDHAYALIALQFALAFANIRGVFKTDE
jgi:hypothetical protein